MMKKKGNRRHRKKALIAFVLIIAVFTLTACGSPNTKGRIVVVSDRHYDTDAALFALFEEETGIRVDVIDGNADQLINRLDIEGERTSADMLFITDAGRLERAKAMGLLRSVESETLAMNVPVGLKDPEGYWFALSKRARIIVYAPERVDSDDLSTYATFAEEKWRRRIAVRPAANLYNQSLVASLIAIYGEEETRAFLEGFTTNFARRPAGNDRDQVKLVAAGDADVAIMNTYYLGRMRVSSDPHERAVAEAVEIFFPNQSTSGAHINVSGAGVTRHANNPEGAVRLIEFLSGFEAQTRLTEENFEYPVNEAVPPSAFLESLGAFVPQAIPLALLGEKSARAAILMDEAGWE